MEELSERILFALKGIWKYRWWAAALSWIVFVVGTTAVLLLPDTYQATARVYVDTQSILKPLLSNMTSIPNLEQQVSVMSRSLLSRPNIEKLIHMTGLDAKVSNSMDFERLAQNLMKDIKISGTGRDDIYTIIYNNRDARLAKDVAQSLLTIFVDGSLGDKKQDTQKAVAFINEQIKMYEQKLSLAENALKEFKIRNSEVLPRDGSTHAVKLAEVSDALEQAKLEWREAEQTRNSLRKKITEEESALEANQKAGTFSDPELDARLQGLHKSLDNLQMQFTERHPDIISTKRLIAELEARHGSQATMQRKENPARPTYGPVLQQLSASLAEAEGNYAALSVRVAEYSSRYAKLKAMVKAVPEVESQIAGLNRDYQVNKENYEKLINRREAAQLSEDLTSTGMVKFRIIEAPMVPKKPYSPNRLLLLSIVLALSLAAGIGGGLLMSQIWPAFMSDTSLREVTGLPVFGAVSMNWTTAQRAREIRATYRLGLIFAGLALAYAAVTIKVL